ncbi:MAG: SDR family oxidoreductase [Candidatus Hydrogenedentes bacterium]|nr:SDR family oxidoreductase [Candidatus Hydrogenedentota bacterium]
MEAENSSRTRGAVLVTGSSTGIGKACALHLNQLGFKVFAGVRKVSDGQALQVEAPGLRPIMIDVTDPDTIKTALSEIGKEVGPAGLHGLVNNAGIVVVGPVETLALDDIRKQFDVNVLGQLAVTQAFLPLIREAKGRVVIMGSIFGLLSCPHVGVYAASKFALEALADAMRVELAPWGIKVSIVEPGRMATSIWSKAFEAMDNWKHDGNEIHELYAPHLSAAVKKAIYFARTSASPDSVARAVGHALIARWPKTRYRVGLDVRFWAPIRRMAPDRISDWAIRLMLRIGR